MKTVINYFVVFFLVAPIGVAGQTYFNKVYDYAANQDVLGTIVKAYGTGYLVVGQSISSTKRALFFVRTNSQGDTLWTKQYGQTNDIYYEGSAGALLKTNDGQYSLVGAYLNNLVGNLDGLFVKFDTLGDTLFSKKYGGAGWDGFHCFLQNADGTYIMSGETSSTGNGGEDMWLIKTDSLGNIIWQKTFGGSSNDNINSICRASDNGYLLAGWTNSYGAGSYDIYIVKVDSSGNFQWQKTFGYSGDDGAEGIIQTSDGNYIITGYVNLPMTSYQAYILKIDSTGTMLWDNNFGGTNIDAFNIARELPDKRLVVIGGLTDSLNLPHGLIMELCGQGDSIWSRSYSKWNGQDYFQDFQIANDGGYVIAGYATNSLSIDGGEDMWIVKTDSLGCDSIGCLPSTVNCSATGIQESTLKNVSCKIYPNPNNGTMQFDYELTEVQSGQLFLYDLTGKIIQSWILKSGQGTMPINEENLNNGIYFYRFIVNGEPVNCDKIIIVK